MSHFTVSDNITELDEFFPATMGDYNPHGRLIISEVRNAAPEPELPSMPALNTTTNTLVNRISAIGKDTIFLDLSKAGLAAAGVGGQNNVAIYLNFEYRDATICWDDADGNEQRVDLDKSDIKQHFGSLAGIFENPLNALKVVNPKIKL